jgi:hypothetical protein
LPFDELSTAAAVRKRGSSGSSGSGSSKRNSGLGNADVAENAAESSPRQADLAFDLSLKQSVRFVSSTAFAWCNNLRAGDHVAALLAAAGTNVGSSDLSPAARFRHALTYFVFPAQPWPQVSFWLTVNVIVKDFIVCWRVVFVGAGGQADAA